MILLYVCIGGAVGAVCRYSLTYLLTNYITKLNASVATLFINSLGSFVLGFILSIDQSTNSPTINLHLITIGFLGSLTTYSTFALDGFKLLQRRKMMPFFIYCGSTFLLVLIMFFIGRNVYLLLY
jgi:fluoride exporter